MYYHASKIRDLEYLKPAVSMHQASLVYLSKKRENVLVYLSNAVEKYCRESGFAYDGAFQKWGPYGFDEDGIIRLEEYYPDALRTSMQGESGYIYCAEDVKIIPFETGIRDVVVSKDPVRVCGYEFIPDAYEAILDAEKQGKLRVLRYDELSERKKEWIGKTVTEEYESSGDHPEYRHFLLDHFPDILK